MSNERQSDDATFFAPTEATADASLVWPPPPEDLAACTLVRLDGADELDGPEPRPIPMPAARVEPPPLPLRKAEPRSLMARVPTAPEGLTFFDGARAEPPKAAKLAFETTGFWGVEQPPPAYHAPEETSVDADTAGDVKRAWITLLVAVACSLVTYTEFRADRRAHADAQPPAPKAAAAAGADAAKPPTAASAPVAPPAIATPPTVDAGGEWPDLLLPLYVGRLHRAAPTPQRPAPQRLAPPPRQPVRATYTSATPPPPPPAARQLQPSPQTVASAVREAPAAPAPAPMVPSRPVTNTTTLATATPPPSRPEPTPSPASVPAPRSEPAPSPAVLTAEAEPIVDDEADIQSTLRRFRAAYSTLNANAAREVYPSVDVRALQRAFQDLKSQELRFDRCNLTVNGPRARAACSGRSTYVPRVGGSSPRTTAREWTFELTKSDQQRWTIASARSS